MASGFESGQLAALLDDLFRRESARLIGSLVRLLGDIDAAEEMLQEAVVAALDRWPSEGFPDNPAGWLMTVARNRALDRLRHDHIFRAKRDEIAREQAIEQTAPPARGESVIPDDRLRLIFTCCHPGLTSEGRIALTLRLIGGLSTSEMARAFLVPEATIAQRVVRSKRIIRARSLPYEVPSKAELPERLSSVLSVIYLVFNEGYAALSGASLIRSELMSEALRLGSMAAELMPGEAEVLGLLALMELQASRNRARTDADGNLVLLADQDRGLWDRELISRGLNHLTMAEGLGELGPYSLQAAIAARHAAAPAWADTDWRAIVSLYERLMRVAPSPIVALNHAVAVSMVGGPAAGLAELDSIGDCEALRGYHHLPAARADFLRQMRRWTDAAAEYRRALKLVRNESERKFLQNRLAECQAHARLPPHI